jgi:hypothetical protein
MGMLAWWLGCMVMLAWWATYIGAAGSGLGGPTHHRLLSIGVHHVGCPHGNLLLLLLLLVR